MSQQFIELVEDIEQYRNDNTAFFVTDYGAVGDGVTDDSQAFINAINAGYLSTQSPKIIVPRGQYNLNHVCELILQYVPSKDLVV